MFKLEEIQFKGHNLLGDQTVKFLDAGERKNANYVSLIIGQNGTGKSQILVAIVDIFNFLSTQPSRASWDKPYQFTAKFSRHGKVVEYDSEKSEITSDVIFDYKQSLPALILANSYTFNDKFSWAKTEGYIYGGLKTTSNNIFVSRPTLDTFSNLSKIILEGDIKLLDAVFEELKFEKSIKVFYTERRNSGLLHDAVFRKLLDDVEGAGKVGTSQLNKLRDIIKSFTGIDKKGKSRRFQDDKIIKLVAEDSGPQLSEMLLWLSRELKQQGSSELQLTADEKDKPKRGRRKKNKDFPIKLEFPFSWGDIQVKKTNKEFIDHIKVYDSLSDLDVLSLKEFQVLRGHYFDFQNVSSGEFHLLHLLSFLISNLKENSLVLLDEPEISLHVNWQQMFFKFIEKVRIKFPSVHFIIASHSHFLVSELKKESSSIISLTKTKDNQIECRSLDKIDTYGWSAEQILFEVFRITSDRNFYLSELVSDTVKELSKSRPNKKKLKQHLDKLSEYDVKNLSENDPLKPVIKKLISYDVA